MEFSSLIPVFVMVRWLLVSWWGCSGELVVAAGWIRRLYRRSSWILGCISRRQQAGFCRGALPDPLSLAEQQREVVVRGRENPLLRLVFAIERRPTLLLNFLS